MRRIPLILCAILALAACVAASVRNSPTALPLFAVAPQQAAVPVIPADAKKVEDVQTAPGWHWNHDAGTPGSAIGASSIVTKPAHSGLTRRFESTTSKYGGEIYSVTYVHDEEASNFLYDGWVYIGAGSQFANLEMDSNQVLANGRTVIYAFQCDGFSKTWDFGGPWVHSKQYCDPDTWARDLWHHVQISYSRASDDCTVLYHAVWLDGKKQTINEEQPHCPALGWAKGVVNTQFQIDGRSPKNSNTLYLSDLTIYRW